MELSYKRYLNQSFMIIEEKNGPCEVYEMNMILDRQVNGLLPLKIVQNDNGYQYWYDITGKQSILTYADREKINGTLLLHILNELQNTCFVIRNYLLEENRLFLSGECIYLCYKTNKIFFTYMPFLHQELSVDFCTFLEFILQKLDHSDKAAVKIGYELYQMMQKEERTLREILCDIAQNRFELNDKQYEVEHKEDNRDLSIEAENILLVSEKVKAPIVGLLTAIIKKNNLWKFFKKKYQKNKMNNQSDYKPVMTVKEADKIENNIYPTEYLSKSEDSIKGKLVYNGSSELKDIILKNDASIIGKDKESADILIEHKSISRIHARLEKVDLEFYLEDLNSTNGTYINEILLEYRDRIKLNKNDKIIFGTVEYIFQ